MALLALCASSNYLDASLVTKVKAELVVKESGHLLDFAV